MLLQPNIALIDCNFQIKEYELSEVFHHSEDDQKYEVLKMEQLTNRNNNAIDNNDIETAIEEERQEQEMHTKPKPKPRTRNYYTANNYYKQYTLSTPTSTSTFYSTDGNTLSNTM